MKNKGSILFYGLLGAILSFFLLKRLPKANGKLPEPKEQFFYIEFSPVYLPANIPEEEIIAIANELKRPKAITPTISPPGWKLEWKLVVIDVPIVGSVSLSLPSKRLPLIPYTNITTPLKEFKPKIEKEAFTWKIIFPQIIFKI